MKRKILIASFFGIIMLMLPCTAAFEMPLTNEGKKELENLLENEEEELQDFFDEIFTSEGELDINEVEELVIYSIEYDDSSVLNSDSFEWILDRLGWIYITLEKVIELYYSALDIYNEFITSYEVVQSWFDSIVDFRAFWQAFKENPINFNNIVNLLNGAIAVLTATINLIQLVGSGALADALEAFSVAIDDFIAFLQGDPWLEPIDISGQVTGFSNSVTVSVKSDSKTTTDIFDLTFTTSDSSLPWFVHKCAVTAEYEGNSKTKNRYAFSMGKIEVDFDESEIRSKSKIANNENIIQIYRLLSSSIFRNIEQLWHSFLKIIYCKSTISL